MYFQIVNTFDLRSSDLRATTYVPEGAIVRAETRLAVIAKTQAKLAAEAVNLRAKIARLRAGLGR